MSFEDESEMSFEDEAGGEDEESDSVSVSDFRYQDCSRNWSSSNMFFIVFNPFFMTKPC